MDARDARIAQLEAEVVELKKLVAALLAENAALKVENTEIKARLGLNSTNSYKPPSSDPPGDWYDVVLRQPAMWTFIQVEGLEPTNNYGERTIRHAVMYRKTSFGTQSAEGSRFVERILTVVTTLRLQNRNVLDYLTTAIHAHRRGLHAPSLLPADQPAQLTLAASYRKSLPLKMLSEGLHA